MAAVSVAQSTREFRDVRGQRMIAVRETVASTPVSLADTVVFGLAFVRCAGIGCEGLARVVFTRVQADLHPQQARHAAA